MTYHTNRALLVPPALAMFFGFGCASNPAPRAETSATGQQAPPPEAAPPEIPPEAFEACNGKSVGDACVTVLEDQATEGQCASAPVDTNDARLMCATSQSHGPRRPPSDGARRPGPGGGPPAESTAACEGKNAGDSCTADMRGRTLTGTCETPPPGAQSQALSCRPPRPAGPDPHTGAQ